MRFLHSAIGILALGSFISCCVAYAADTTHGPGFGPEDLPAILIHFGVREEINGLDGIPKHPDTAETIDKLNYSLQKSLEGLGVHLETSMGFGHLSFIVQPDIPGNVYKINTNDRALYATAPLHNLGNRIVAIWTAFGPESGTIFSLDEKLHTVLIYDTFKKSEFAEGKDCYPVGQIIEVRIDRPNVLRLTDSNHHFSDIPNRSYLLDLSGSEPRFICTQSGH